MHLQLINHDLEKAKEFSSLMLGFTKVAYFTTQLTSLLFHYVESKFGKFLSFEFNPFLPKGFSIDE